MKNIAFPPYGVAISVIINIKKEVISHSMATLNEVLSARAPHAGLPAALNTDEKDPSSERKWSSLIKVWPYA